MRVVTACRASTILYHLACSRPTGVCLVPANVCPVVPLACLSAGWQLEMVDLDPETLCCDWPALEARVEGGSPPVTALVYVRTYGAMGDAGPLFQRLKALAPQLCIIDDRCVTRPETDLERPDMQGADVVLFSTGYAKYVDLGLGGFAFLDDTVRYEEHQRPFQAQALAEVIALYKRAIAEDRPLYIDGTDDPARQQLQEMAWLDTRPLELSWREMRRKVIAERDRADRWKRRCNAIYRQIIPEPAQLPAALHSWRFQVRVHDKHELLRQIFDAGLFASGHYFPASILFGGTSCPEARKLYDEIVNLNNDRYISEQQVTQLAEIVRAHIIRTTTGTEATP
jgi:dTDP-4-amino-4,6-dideoxygalactose transaminase